MNHFWNWNPEDYKTFKMLQITRLDLESLAKHIAELNEYVEKMIRENHSPIRIAKYRFQISQLQEYLNQKCVGPSNISSNTEC